MLGVVLVVTAPALAGPNVRANLPVPASVFTQGTVEGCSNNPGPFITLSGELALGGVSGRLIFRNNVKGTHQAEEPVTVDVVLLQEGETIRFNKQPSRGGVGGNPWIYAEFSDGGGSPISDEILFGRCVQGLDPTMLDFEMMADAELTVTTGECQNSGGPTISLVGELTLSGLGARIIFRNNQKGTHEHDEYTDVDVNILDPGESITIAKQPPRGGAGGNPLIWFQFVDGNGDPYGGEIFLGKCNKIGR
jgi:hypothetical protein